jgi:hypothetical protein
MRVSRRLYASDLVDRPAKALIAGAAAQMAGHCIHQRFRIGLLAAVSQRSERHHHARRAETALQRIAFPHRLLDQVQRAIRRRHALHGGDLRTVGLHRLAVDRDRAGPANAMLAGKVDASIAQVRAQEVGERHARLDAGMYGLGVDRDLYLMLAHAASLRLRTSFRQRAKMRRPTLRR